MPHCLCPAWAGGLLAHPLRRLWHPPEKLLSPHVRVGMTVLDVGPGMGFFSLPLARLVGAEGRVVCVDLQEEMLRGLERRARRAHLEERIELRRARPDSLDLPDWEGRIDFALAFAVVHEMPDPRRFFGELARLLKPGGRCLLTEPRGHVGEPEFAAELEGGRAVGLTATDRPRVVASHAALLVKD